MGRPIPAPASGFFEKVNAMAFMGSRQRATANGVHVSELSLLGKNRGSGYRWLRSAENSEQSVGTATRRLSAKIFSMDPATARSNFWRAAQAMALGRGFDMDEILTFLRENGVEID